MSCEPDTGGMGRTMNRERVPTNSKRRVEEGGARRAGVPRRWLMDFVLLAALAATGSAAAAPTSLDGVLRPALDSARRTGRPVAVLVHATWCEPCHELIGWLHGDEGASLRDRAVWVNVDFDTPLGAETAKRYRVLGLPTVVVLDPAGHAIGRVVGFDDPKATAAALEALFEGRAQSLDALEARAKAGEGDATIELARSLFERGRADDARAWLAKARKLDRDFTQGIAARAATTEARYWIRAAGKPLRAVELLEAELPRVAGKKGEASVRYWLATALVTAGEPRKAVAVLDAYLAAHAGKDDEPDARLLVADFLAIHRLDAARIGQLATRVLEARPDDAEAWYLRAVAAHRQGDDAAALRYARRAAKAAPERALFGDFLAELEAARSSAPPPAHP